MDRSSYEAYAAEAETWLKRGRRELLETLVRQSVPKKQVRVLEIGAGVGQNISILAKYGLVDAVEIDAIGIAALQKNEFINTLYTKPLPFELDTQYDVIVALDVIEHIENDAECIRWIKEHLRAEGVFLATVPAYQWLFTDHDEALGHFRRYTKGALEKVVNIHLSTIRSGYFNSILFPLAAITRLPNVFLRKWRRATKPEKQSGWAPDWLDRFFGWIVSFEGKVIGIGVNPTLGLSCYIVARKSCRDVIE